MMHWTQFGRVGSELAQIPRARLEGNPRRNDESPNFAEALDAQTVEQSSHDAEEPASALPSDAVPSAADDPQKIAAPTAESEPDARVDDAEFAGEGESASQTLVDEPSPAPRPSAETLSENATSSPQLAAAAHAAPASQQQASTPAIRSPNVLSSFPLANVRSQATAPILRSATLPAVGGERIQHAAPLQRRSLANAAHTAELHDSLIKKIALKSTESGGDLRVLLEPRELGAVALRLQLDGKTLRLEMTAENRDTAAVLERESARIVDELAALGLEVEDVDIETGSRQDQRARQQDFAHEHGAHENSQSTHPIRSAEHAPSAFTPPVEDAASEQLDNASSINTLA